MTPVSGATSVINEFRRGWTVVLACTVGFALGGSGLIFYTSGVFADALRNEFHWKMAALQSGSLITAAMSLGLTPLTGWLIDRFGARRVAIPAMTAFGLCFMALSLQDGRYSTYVILWILMAFASAGTFSIVWSRTVSGWFSAGRGLALGVTLLGTGLTSFIAPPLAAHLIAIGGWRFAYIAMGAGAMVIALPILFVFLRDNIKATTRAAEPVEGHSTGQAVRDWRFWVMWLCLFCVTVTVSGFISNFVKLMTGHGFTRVDAAWVASTTGVFVIFGRLACGYLLDRLHGPWVGAAFFMGLPVACLLMAQPHFSRPAAVAAAALVGLGAAAELDVIPYLVSRYFGLRRLGSVLGLVMLAFNIGAGVGPIAFARAFDQTGSYHAILLGAAVLSLLGGASLIWLGPYRKPPIAEAVDAFAPGVASA